MCCVGDIILIKEFKNEDGQVIPIHPFVVVDDQEDKIQGLDFDMVGVLMSSFKNDEHRRRKLSMRQNLEITVEDGVKKDGYLKANQLHYFKKENTNYITVGKVDDDLLEALLELIQTLNRVIVNTRNLVND